jgi:ribonuclease R
MRERGLAREFEPELEREAERAREQGRDALAAQVAERRRRDLRELPTLTIDPATARDFDDAISAERLPGGGMRVWVHIADVCAYVSEGSLVDLEARRRGTSVYVPGAVEPMLPEALSNDACSLVPGAERAGVTVELELHGSQVARTAFHRSLIRSDIRLDYERVDRIFAGRERAEDPWATPLSVAREAAAALAAARAQAGALLLDSAEPEFLFDSSGNPTAILVREATESHRLIEHLMVAANEAVARMLSERGIPCLYRVHERPEPARVRRLIEQLATLEVPTPPVPDSLSRAQAAELMGEVSGRIERHVLSTIERAARRHGRGSHEDGSPGAPIGPWGGRPALRTLVLGALQQARYSPENLGHAGLRSGCYCHFTSPIRRYPDVVCHRALLSALGSGEAAPRARDLRDLGDWTSEREREAMVIERDSDDIARCFYLEQALYESGWEQAFLGEVTGLISAGAFVAFGGSGAACDPGTHANSREGGHPRARGYSRAASGSAAAARPAIGAPAIAGADTAGPLYEGMLPVRRMLLDSGERDWWELNELATVLHGERTGATLRLGDPIAVRVARVDAAQGRVDLIAALDGTPVR